MAKTPTLGEWELELLRTVEHVVRLGHIRHVTSTEIVLDGGSVPLAPGALVVHCAASGLVYPPVVPVWGPDRIRVQTIRAGFPCFNAALAGYVEATRDDDRERNRLCPPNTLPDRPGDWAWMQVRGTAAARSYGAEPDVAAWANALRAEPGAGRAVPARRSRGAGRGGAAGGGGRARARPVGGARATSPGRASASKAAEGRGPVSPCRSRASSSRAGSA